MHLKTQQILKTFEEINKIPRRSKNEEKLALWLLEWARNHNLEAKTDNLNNVLIKVPPTPGYENSPIIVLQGHMDMVCEKCRESKHDFSKDPIKCVYDGDWLRGDGTSIGADNGIALAIGLVLAEAGIKGEIENPPLELLFTVDEETGLTGASGLEEGFFEGRILLNLDSEDEGIFIVGCAGGKNSRVALPVNWEPFDYGNQGGFGLFRLSIEGLEGGHSGTEIHRQRANGIQLLARLLRSLKEKVGKENLRLVFFSGGSVHNAIPNYSEAFIALLRSKEKQAEDFVSDMQQTLKDEYAVSDPEITIQLKEVENRAIFEASRGKVKRKEVPSDKVFSAETEERLFGMLLGMPHGVHRVSDTISGLVETSNNLAVVRTREDEVRIISSQRSSVMSRLAEVTGKVETVAKLAGARVEHECGYPAWEPNLQAGLLKNASKLMQRPLIKSRKLRSCMQGLNAG